MQAEEPRRSPRVRRLDQGAEAGSTEEDVFRKTWNVSVAAHSVNEVKLECKTHEQETRASCTKAAPLKKK